MQREGAEHWGDIKSDFVPLMGREFLEFCQASTTLGEEIEKRKISFLLHHKLNCEKQSSMSSVACALFM